MHDNFSTDGDTVAMRADALDSCTFQIESNMNLIRHSCNDICDSCIPYNDLLYNYSILHCNRVAPSGPLTPALPLSLSMTVACLETSHIACH